MFYASMFHKMMEQKIRTMQLKKVNFYITNAYKIAILRRLEHTGPYRAHGAHGCGPVGPAGCRFFFFVLCFFRKRMLCLKMEYVYEKKKCFGDILPNVVTLSLSCYASGSRVRESITYN